MRKEKHYALGAEPSLGQSLEFSKPDEKIMARILEHLQDLPKQNWKFVIERPLKKKGWKLFSDVRLLMNDINKNLSENFEDFFSGFSGEPLGFSYYLGNELLYSGSVEVVQKIFDKENSKTGHLYYALVVKFNKGKYYYWEL